MPPAGTNMTKRFGPILILVAFLLPLLGGVVESRAAVSCLVGGVPQVPAPVAAALEGYNCGGDLTVWSAAGDPADPDGGAFTVAAIVNNGGSVTVAGNMNVQASAILKVTNVTDFSLFDIAGNLTVASSARIDLDGQAALSQPPGSGGAGRNAGSMTWGNNCAGSGAGHGGAGGQADTGLAWGMPGGIAYGNALAPLFPGSSGGTGLNDSGTLSMAGGTGGGSIRLVVGGTFTLDGMVTANGTDGQTWGGGTFTKFKSLGGGGGGGSGGAIVVSASTLTTTIPGVIHLRATGGKGGDGNGLVVCSDGGGGAGGRVMVYSTPGGMATSDMSCLGGSRGLGTGSTLVQSGGDGTCQVGTPGIAPTATAMNPVSLGQGGAPMLVSVTGTDVRAGAVFKIDGAQPGAPLNGITITNTTVYPPDRIDAFVQVGFSAVAGPKPVQVVNADFSASVPANLFTVVPAPVVTGVSVDGVLGAAAPRGFSYTLGVSVSNLQAGAVLNFVTTAVVPTGPAAVDPGAGTITVPVFVAENAPAGAALFNVVNPDGGSTQVAGTLVVESRPVITGIAPDLVFAGQTDTPVRVQGHGFILASTVQVGGTGVTARTRFDSFNQMTAWVSVPVESEVNLTETCLSAVAGEPCRDLTVFDRDPGGTLSNRTRLRVLPPPAGTNSADLVLMDGTSQPKTRYWNGFGWSSEGVVGTPLAQPGAAVHSDILTGGQMLAAVVDQADGLLFRTRMPVITGGVRDRAAESWTAGSTTPALLAAGGRAVDVVALNGSASFLSVYGLADGTLRYRTVFDGSDLDTVYAPGIAGCANDVANPVTRVRLAPNRAGTKAVLAFVRQDGALCAAEWNGTAFGAETILRPAGIYGVSTEAFDATWFGITSEQAMVAWGAAGLIAPQAAVWTPYPVGATPPSWAGKPAQNASGDPAAVINRVRLAPSRRSARVALVSTTSVGELYGQVWSGDAWGTTGPELATPVLGSGATMRAGGEAFDVAWSHVQEEALLVFGVSGAYAPRASRWSASVGWSSTVPLPAPDLGVTPPSPLPDPRLIVLDSDPASTTLLAGVVDWNGDAGRSSRLTYYAWNGAAWSALGLPGRLPVSGTPLALAFDRVAPPDPSISATIYDGALPSVPPSSPAAIGARSTGQLLRVEGTGFLNPPIVSFSNPLIQVVDVAYRNATLLEVTVDIGDLAPGFQSLQVTNPNQVGVPGAMPATLTNALNVLPAPNIGGVTTSSTCTLSTAPGCIPQESAGVQVVIAGTGFGTGSQVVFDNGGIRITTPPVLTPPALPGGDQLLTMTVSVAGDAPPGPSNVRVVNPDSSTGVGTGMVVVERRVGLSTVVPNTAGVGAVSRTVTVTGSNLQPGVSFDFGAAVQVLSVVWQNSSQVQVELSVASNAAPGPRSVTVTNPDGGTAVVSAPGTFEVTASPGITTFTPGTSDQGTTVPVTVTGSGFSLVDPGTGIGFSGTGVAVSGAVVVSDTQIQFDAVIDPDAPFDAPRDLILTDSRGGRTVFGNALVVRAVPVVTAITPGNGTLGELGKRFTLSGIGFDPLATVLVGGGGQLATQTYVSQTRIDLVLNLPGPADATVTVVNPDGRIAAPALTVTLGALSNCDAIGAGVRVELNASTPNSCASITVGSGATLALVGDITVTVAGNVLVQAGGTLSVDPESRFARLAVGGNMTIEATGKVDATGTGYPGGRLGAPGEGPGGGPPSARSNTTFDSGKGGGFGGRGGDGQNAGSGGATYDLDGVCVRPNCLSFPFGPGSGGGSGYVYSNGHWWRPGGNGGGAVVLDVAGTVTLNGTVAADGTDGLKMWEGEAGGTKPGSDWAKGAGGGSGGSLLILGNAVAGTGAVSAQGGSGSPLGTSLDPGMGTGGGGGRVAVLSRTGPLFGGTLTCSGGQQGGGITNPAYDGQAGTCLNMAMPEILSITPPLLGQGAVGSVTVTGNNLVAGDDLRVFGQGVTGGALATAGVDFSVPVAVAVDAPIGTRDVLVTRGGPSPETNGFAIGFDALEIGAVARMLSVSPSLLFHGQVVPVTVGGTYLEPVGAVLRFLQNGVEPMCAGGTVACVSATIDEPASGFSQLVLPALTVAADAPVGAYDLELQLAGGTTALMTSGVIVRSADGSAPVLTGMLPGVAGEAASGVPVTLIGYDFSTGGVGTVASIATSLGPDVTLAPVAGGCLEIPAQCNTQPDGRQSLAVTVTSNDLTLSAPLAVDVSVSNAAAAGSTLFGGLTLNPRPSLSVVSPASGQGTFQMTVSGLYIQPGAVVAFDDASGDGLPAIVGATTAPGGSVSAQVTVPEIKAETPVTVRVTNPDGGFGLLTPLVLNPAPTITGVSPPALGQGETVWLTVTGTGFHPQATVAINDPNIPAGGTADITVWAVQRLTPETLRVQVTATDTADRIPRDITVSNPNGVSFTAPAILNIVAPRILRVTSVTVNSTGLPAVGAGARRASVTISGTEFSGIDLSRIRFSNSGIHLLTTKTQSDYDPSKTYTQKELVIDKELTVYVREVWSGGVRFTSFTVPVRVDAGAEPGTGTVTIYNSNGSSASHPFTVNPAPGVVSVTPSVLTRGHTYVDVTGDHNSLVVRGSNIQGTPRVCIGDSCNFSTLSTQVDVVGVHTANTSEAHVAVKVEPLASVGSYALTLENPDGGRFTRSSAVQVLSGFTVTGIVDTTTRADASDIVQGTTGAAVTITGSGFTTVPQPGVQFLLPDGTVDPEISGTVLGSATATDLDLSLSVTGGAPSGMRSIRVQNGDGAMVEVRDFLLVATATGPTIGSLQVPASASFAEGAQLGLDASNARVITGVTLTGSGFDPADFTLSFEDGAGAPWSGISFTAPLVDPGGKSATFDLTLASTTMPGAVSVRVTSPAGLSDLRSGMLQVNPAPVVSLLSPAVGRPAATDLSIRIDGAGFMPQAAIVATATGGGPAAGIMPRDLQPRPPAPALPGDQVVWVSSATVRANVDILATATGTYTLEVVNPDGGRAGLPFGITVAQDQVRAKVSYLGAIVDSGLKVRDWTGTTELAPPLLSGPSSTLPHTTTVNDLWNVMAANPAAPGQYLMAVGQAARRSSLGLRSVDLYRTLADGTAWEKLGTVPATSSYYTQAFDLAYEQGVDPAVPASHSALLVYGGVDGRLYYSQVYNTGAGAADMTPAQEVRVGTVPMNTSLSDVQWVRLVPRSGTRQILVVYLNAAAQLHAVVWDGATGAFVSQYSAGVISSSAGRGEAGVRKAGFDGAWQGQSGKAVVVWGESGSGSLFAVTWDPGTLTWSAPTASASALSSSGPVFVEAEGDRNTDRVAILAQFAYDMPLFSSTIIEHALVSNFWGAAWGAPEVFAARTTLGEAPSGVSYTVLDQAPSVVAGRNFDLAWDTRGNLVALYTEVHGPFSDRGYRVRSRTWSPATNSWSASTQDIARLYRTVYYTSGVQNRLMSIPVAVEIKADPWSDEMLALVLEGGTGSQDLKYTSYLSPYKLWWNGTGWGAQEAVAPSELVNRWAERGSSRASDSTSRHFGQALDVAWRADRVPPSDITLSEMGRSGGGVVVGWTAPGGDGSTGLAGGYDLRWSSKTIIDCAVATVADPANEICFDQAEQILPVPMPASFGTAQTATINFARTVQDETAQPVWHAALMAGDRDNRIDPATGAHSLWGNRSNMASLTVTLSSGDTDPPGGITDLVATAGAVPSTQARLTWTGVGNDGSVVPGGPVFGYDVRIAPLPISEVGGPDNFEIPFDKVARSEFVAPAVTAGETYGVANSTVITGLEPGTTYHFAVKGVDGNPGHYAPVSNVVSVTTAQAPLGVVTDLAATAISSSNVTLVWTAPDGGPTSYDLRVSTSPIVDAASFDAAVRIPYVPAPMPAGTRQAFLLGGLASGTVHYAALVPVRWEWVNGVLERRPVELFRAGDAVVQFTTQVDDVVGSTRPSAVNDLSLVAGTVRTGEARLTWSAPQAAGGRAARYEFQWAVRPIALAAPAEIHKVWVPLLPGAEGLTQEFTVTGLPENAQVYVILMAYDGAGRASAPSNEVSFHTALRLGLNPVSVPGQLANPVVATNLLPIVGSCVSGGATSSGAGPVGPCGSGQTIAVKAWGWDPAGGSDINGDAVPDGDFVVLDATTATLNPGRGIFVAASGTQSVLDIVGADLGLYPPVPLAANGMTLISNPHNTPVAVADLVIREAGGATWTFGNAVTASLIGPELYFLTGSGGATTFQPVVSGDLLLPHRAYFIRLLPTAVGTYSVEVP